MFQSIVCGASTTLFEIIGKSIEKCCKMVCVNIRLTLTTSDVGVTTDYVHASRDGRVMASISSPNAEPVTLVR